jgi:Fibronectin type III domain
MVFVAELETLAFRFGSSAEAMPQFSIYHTLACLIVLVMWLVTTSCGDFQDPASGAGNQATTSNDPTPPPALPEMTPSYNPAQPTNTNGFPVGPVDQSSPGQSISHTPSDAPFVPPQTRSVTFAWNPSVTQDLDGYHVRITSLSTSWEYMFSAGRETMLTVNLPVGEIYAATVVAYNRAGESPPSTPVIFAPF